MVDLDGDGSLNQDELNRAREFGLDPEELLKKSVRADLTALIEASHAARLLPTSYTAAIARREARLTAVTEVEEMERSARENRGDAKSVLSECRSSPMFLTVFMKVRTQEK